MELPILELKAPWPLVNVEEEDCELVVNFHPEAFLWPAVEEVGITLLCLVDETDGGALPCFMQGRLDFPSRSPAPAGPTIRKKADPGEADRV